MFKLHEFPKTNLFFPGCDFTKTWRSSRGGVLAWLPGELVRIPLTLLQTQTLLPFWKSHALFDGDLVQLSYFKTQCLHF